MPTRIRQATKLEDDASSSQSLSAINVTRLNVIKLLRECPKSKFLSPATIAQANVLLRPPRKRASRQQEHAHHPEGCICCGRTECVSFHELKRRQDLYKHLFPNASGKDKWCHECCKNCGSQARTFGAVFCHRKDVSSILFKTNCSLGWHTRFDPRCNCLSSENGNQSSADPIQGRKSTRKRVATTRYNRKANLPVEKAAKRIVKPYPSDSELDDDASSTSSTQGMGNNSDSNLQSSHSHAESATASEDVLGSKDMQMSGVIGLMSLSRGRNIENTILVPQHHIPPSFPIQTTSQYPPSQIVYPMPHYGFIPMLFHYPPPNSYIRDGNGSGAILIEYPNNPHLVQSQAVNSLSPAMIQNSTIPVAASATQAIAAETEASTAQPSPASSTSVESQPVATEPNSIKEEKAE